MKRRRRSYGADSPEVVTTDHIRPDWEAKLAAVRAAVTRRANRRIIMRQVGDRLIPVGVTSGRVHALPEDGSGENGDGNGNNNERGSRRSRRRPQNQDLNQLLGQMGLGGQDIEELMLMEAMRLSLLDHEEHQKKEAEERKKKAAEEAAAAVQSQSDGVGPSTGLLSADSLSAGRANTSSASLPSGEPTSTPNTPVGERRSPSPSPSSHRASSSLSEELPPDSSIGLSGWKRRSTTPSGSIIGAAIRSAASTASAVTSPVLDGSTATINNAEPAADIHEPAISAESSISPSATPIPAPNVTITPPEGLAEPPFSSEAPSPNLARPMVHHNESSASSLGTDDSSTYGLLPSSAGSSTASMLSQEPLLDGVKHVGEPPSGTSTGESSGTQA